MEQTTVKSISSNKPEITMNLSCCKYQVIRTVCERLGIQYSDIESEWSVWWMDNPGIT